MSGTVNESLSMKERTKSKFDQLLKAALDDVKGDVSKKKRRSAENDEIIPKVETGDNTGALQETDYNGSDLNRLYEKSKRKEDKEGLINAGFNEDGGQMDNKASKNNYSLPSVFSKSSAKLEAKNKKLSDVIELVPYGNLVCSNNKIDEKANVETKNLVNAADPQQFNSNEHPNNEPQTRKHRKKKQHRDKASSSANAEVLNVDSNISKHNKRVEKQKSKQAKGEAQADTVLEPQVATADKEALKKEIVIYPVKKPRAKRREKSATQLEISEQERSDNVQNEKILSVKIHRVDRLKLNVNIKHPLVRVHIVDGNTGTCVKQRKKGDTPVHENTQTNLGYISPALTLPFKLNEKRSVIPVWEEILYFNESFEHITLESTNAVLFFEVLDFLPMTAASSQYNKLGAESGWYHIAWAFLKIVGANNKLNVGRRMQLQLYFPPKHRIRPEPRVLEVFNWWASCPRVPYPATLYVTVSTTDPPVVLQPTPLSPVNDQAGTSGYELRDSKRLSDEIPSERKDRSGSDSNSYKQWVRLPGQSCKVPNKLWLNLKTASKGCLVADFSHNGKWIACGCHDNDTSPILIYEIPSGEFNKKLLGHTSLIYEVKFSPGDDLLLSASADGTARVWSMQSSIQESVIVLPHPSYVYTAQFHPLIRSVVVTGCYDTVIRIWDISAGTENQKHLMKELEGHNAYVNSICFNGDGTKMYSGDSKGMIHIWDVPNNSDHLKGVNGSWNLCETISCPELMEISISKVVHHPKLPRLLIQSQDSVIRMLDLESLQILQRYKGYLNICDYLRSCITPCGNFIFTGSEDHCVYAWNTVTGVQAAIYSNLPHRQTIHCTVFHPLDHFVAFCSFGSNLPVLIYKYDPHVGQLGVSRVQPQESSQTEKLVSLVPTQNLSSSSRNLSLEESKRAEDFHFTGATTSSARLKTIIKKLDSVLDISSAVNTSLPEFDGQDVNATNMSWGSTFDGLGINPSAPMLKEVIAKFDYSSQRSDELSFKQGDVVGILDMESDQWWIGRLADGRHGYVPAKFFSQNESIGEGNLSLNRTKDHFNVEDKHRNVTALLTKDGELTFMSASDDENVVTTSTPIKRQRRRRKKEKDVDGVSHC